MHLEVKVLIVQLCLTVCNSMHCSPQGSSVPGILRARILEWIAILFSRGKNTGVDSHSLFQGIFPTQGSNPGLLHYRQILYHLSHQESPWIIPKPSCPQSIENWPSAKPVPGAKKYCCHRRSGEAVEVRCATDLALSYTRVLYIWNLECLRWDALRSTIEVTSGYYKEFDFAQEHCFRLHMKISYRNRWPTWDPGSHSSID